MLATSPYILTSTPARSTSLRLYSYIQVYSGATSLFGRKARYDTVTVYNCTRIRVTQGVALQHGIILARTPALELIEMSLTERSPSPLDVYVCSIVAVYSTRGEEGRRPADQVHRRGALLPRTHACLRSIARSRFGLHFAARGRSGVGRGATGRSAYAPAPDQRRTGHRGRPAVRSGSLWLAGWLGSWQLEMEEGALFWTDEGSVSE